MFPNTSLTWLYLPDNFLNYILYTHIISAVDDIEDNNIILFHNTDTLIFTVKTTLT